MFESRSRDVKRGLIKKTRIHISYIMFMGLCEDFTIIMKSGINFARSWEMSLLLMSLLFMAGIEKAALEEKKGVHKLI